MWEGYEYILLVIVGFVVGFVNTLAGGGSMITLYFLISMGLPSSVANGTNRVAVLLQNTMAIAGFKSKGVSTYPFNIYLGISALIGAIIGARIAVDISNQVFNKVLAVIMIFVVLIIILRPKLKVGEMEERLTGKYLFYGIVAFFLIGIYGGFINVGIGFVIILFLHFVHRMDLIRTNATKVAVVFIYTLSALAVFVLNDKVNWKIGLILAIGNSSGAWVASRAAVSRGEGLVKIFLVIMAVAMSIKLWFYNI